MSSGRRSVEGELPDGIADREAGYSHNPNPDDEVALQRARFEEAQRKLQEDRAAASEVAGEVQQRLVEQYEQEQNDPEHQQFIDEQIAHGEIDVPYSRGGQEIPGDEQVGVTLPQNAEVGRHIPMPTTAEDAKEFNRE